MPNNNNINIVMASSPRFNNVTWATGYRSSKIEHAYHTRILLYCIEESVVF